MIKICLQSLLHGNVLTCVDAYQEPELNSTARQRFEQRRKQWVPDFVGVDSELTLLRFPSFSILVSRWDLCSFSISLSPLSFPSLGRLFPFPVKNPDVDGMILIPVHSQGSDVPVWATRPWICGEDTGSWLALRDGCVTVAMAAMVTVLCKAALKPRWKHKKYQQLWSVQCKKVRCLGRTVPHEIPWGFQ